MGSLDGETVQKTVSGTADAGVAVARVGVAVDGSTPADGIGCRYAERGNAICGAARRLSSVPHKI